MRISSNFPSPLIAMSSAQLGRHRRLCVETPDPNDLLGGSGNSDSDLVRTRSLVQPIIIA